MGFPSELYRIHEIRIDVFEMLWECNDRDEVELFQCPLLPALKAEIVHQDILQQRRRGALRTLNECQACSEEAVIGTGGESELVGWHGD